MSEEIVKYETLYGEVTLSTEIVRRLLISGDHSKITDEEIMMFIKLCRSKLLNPFLREAYLVKYSGSEPATIVVGRDVFTRRAASISWCRGWKAGVVVLNEEGEVIERDGALVLPKETLVGGWAIIFQEKREPFKHMVSIEEYIQKDRDGNPLGFWKQMGATIIRNIALVQAIREVFPEFQGMYASEEFGIPSQPPANAVFEEIIGVENGPVKEAQKEEQKETQSGNQKKVNWTQFWTDVRNLGFTPQEAHKIMGVSNFKGMDNEALWKVLKRLSEEAQKRSAK